MATQTTQTTSTTPKTSTDKTSAQPKEHKQMAEDAKTQEASKRRLTAKQRDAHMKRVADLSAITPQDVDTLLHGGERQARSTAKVVAFALQLHLREHKEKKNTTWAVQVVSEPSRPFRVGKDGKETDTRMSVQEIVKESVINRLFPQINQAFVADTTRAIELGQRLDDASRVGDVELMAALHKIVKEAQAKAAAAKNSLNNLAAEIGRAAMLALQLNNVGNVEFVEADGLPFVTFDAKRADGGTFRSSVALTHKTIVHASTGKMGDVPAEAPRQARGTRNTSNGNGTSTPLAFNPANAEAVLSFVAKVRPEGVALDELDAKRKEFLVRLIAEATAALGGRAQAMAELVSYDKEMAAAKAS